MKKRHVTHIPQVTFCDTVETPFLSVQYFINDLNLSHIIVTFCLHRFEKSNFFNEWKNVTRHTSSEWYFATLKKQWDVTYLKNDLNLWRFILGSSSSAREDDLRVTDLLNEFQSLEEHEVKSFFSTLVNNQVRIHP